MNKIACLGIGVYQQHQNRTGKINLKYLKLGLLDHKIKLPVQ
jgi:hypothetical protein